MPAIGSPFGINFKHFIEVSKAKKKQGIILEALAGLAVLLHHGSFTCRLFTHKKSPVMEDPRLQMVKGM
jgi:hypothetical protein